MVGEDEQVDGLRTARRSGQPHRIDDLVGGERQSQRLKVTGQRLARGGGCEFDGDDLPSVGDVGRQVRVQAVGVWKAVVRQPLRQGGGILGGQPCHIEGADPLTAEDVDACSRRGACHGALGRSARGQPVERRPPRVAVLDARSGEPSEFVNASASPSDTWAADGTGITHAALSELPVTRNDIRMSSRDPSHATNARSSTTEAPFWSGM